jgi:hypothetical protein
MIHLLIVFLAEQEISTSMEENLNGRLEHLTAEQEGALKEFKKLLIEENCFDKEKHDDYLLLRFLRARQFKLPAAKEMWMKAQNWRKENGIDTVGLFWN